MVSDNDVGVIELTNNVMIARAREHPRLADKVFVSEVTEDDPSPLPLPYIMIFCDNGQRTSDMLVQDMEKAYFNYTVHFVGLSHTEVNRMADDFYGQWLNWRPSIPGWRAFKVNQNFSTPDNTNDAVKPPMIYRVDEWGLRLVKGKVVTP